MDSLTRSQIRLLRFDVVEPNCNMDNGSLHWVHFMVLRAIRWVADLNVESNNFRRERAHFVGEAEFMGSRKSAFEEDTRLTFLFCSPNELMIWPKNACVNVK
eukprot:TRINITY_DN3489_c0_g4_i1.p2 TRINITY_DN3489_c0_g4~~TRINITY_DN3489_c0_g4_i1.p2  ORF type:complete len:102 (+),score=5.07 TRINITY_DN3489_c0_g4_i1:161-466(+)